jgi:hypothetical protein
VLLNAFHLRLLNRRLPGLSSIKAHALKLLPIPTKRRYAFAGAGTAKPTCVAVALATRRSARKSVKGIAGLMLTLSQCQVFGWQTLIVTRSCQITLPVSFSHPFLSISRGIQAVYRRSGEGIQHYCAFKAS